MAVSLQCDFCEPLPDWLRLVLLGATLAIFCAAVIWAIWTIRRRRG